MAKYRRLKIRWREAAVCRDEDPELFFPIGQSGPAQLQAEQAKAVCKNCPAIGHCALEALEVGVDGIWGGMTEEERRAASVRSQRPGGLPLLFIAQRAHDDFAVRHPDSETLPPVYIIEETPPPPPEANSARTPVTTFRA